MFRASRSPRQALLPLSPQEILTLAASSCPSTPPGNLLEYLDRHPSQDDRFSHENEPYDDGDSFDGDKQTQSEILSHLTPPRRLTLSSEATGISDGSPMELTVRFNSDVVDRLLADCPAADLSNGHGGGALHGYASRIKTSCFKRRGAYEGLKETYKFGASTREYGRLYCAKGAQSLAAELRRHLFHGLYDDLDIVNAQPCMLVQLMSKLQYDGPRGALQWYCDNRSTALELVCDVVNARSLVECTPKDAKQLFISVIFGGSASAWSETHGPLEPTSNAPESHRDIANLVQQYEQEVRAFVSPWFEDRYGAEVGNRDRKSARQLQSEGKSVPHRHLALYLQNEERLVMQHVIRWVQANDGEVGVLIHDGALVHWEGERRPDFGVLSTHVSVFAGYRLEFALKPLAPTKSLDEVVAALRQSSAAAQAVLPEYDAKLKQDGFYCDYFMQLNKDRIIFDTEGAIYHYADEAYDHQPSLRGTWVKAFPPGSWFTRAFPDTPFSQDMSTMSRMRSEVKHRYPERRFDHRWEQYPLHWIPLQDCLLNMITGETCLITPEHMLNRKILVRYRPDALTAPEYASHAAKLREDNARLYNNDAGLESAVEERIAYGVLTRGNPLKKLPNFVGDGDNGKSTVWNRALTTLGGQFVTPIGAKQFSGRATATSANSHLRAAVMCNLAVIEEPDRSEPMCAAMLKELSGNTRVKVRALYDNGNDLLENNALFIVMSNHPYTVKHPDQAYLNRIERICMPCTFFKSEALKQAALREIDCPLERAMKQPGYHVGDPHFAERYQTDKMREVYLASLVGNYRTYVIRGGLAEIPDAYGYADCEEAALEPSLRDVYEEAFEETTDDANTMTIQQIAAVLKQRQIETNVVALGRFMSQRIKHGKVLKAHRNKRQKTFVGLKAKAYAVQAYDVGY
jgi:hypothetical protein